MMILAPKADTVENSQDACHVRQYGLPVLIPVPWHNHQCFDGWPKDLTPLPPDHKAKKGLTMMSLQSDCFPVVHLSFFLLSTSAGSLAAAGVDYPYSSAGTMLCSYVRPWCSPCVQRKLDSFVLLST